MPCPCGSFTCSCDGKCFCQNINCLCSVCESMPKLCFRCRLPSHAVVSNENYAHQVCSCNKRTATILHPETHYNLLPCTDSEMSYQSSVASTRQDICPRCNLPVLTDEFSARNPPYCCCHLKKRISAHPGELQSEHETTSNSTSDHREVSADRQVRKALSRKTRNEKSNWQAKKVKDSSPPTSGEGCSTNSDTDTISVIRSPDPFLARPSNTPLAAVIVGGGFQNLNTLFNQPRIGGTPTDNVVLCNTSGAAAQSAPQSYQPIRCIMFNQNLPRQIPRPFPPSLPNPIPGPPAFGTQVYPPPQLAHVLNINNARMRTTPRPFAPLQAPVERREKMERWFETIENVLNTSGELPSAEAAATLDQMDKEQQMEEEPYSYPVELHQSGSVAAASDNGKEDAETTTETTTDTDRSTTVSKSHKESESD